MLAPLGNPLIVTMGMGQEEAGREIVFSARKYASSAKPVSQFTCISSYYGTPPRESIVQRCEHVATRIFRWEKTQYFANVE